jgi:Lantibiotic dehydratase, N terminus
MQTATVIAEAPSATDHLITVPGSECAFWRCVCVRGAGFPAEGILKLAAAPEIVAAADRVIQSHQEIDRAQKSALERINRELDLFRSTGQWDDKKGRKVLLDARRAVSDNKIPRHIPEGLAAVIKEYERTLRQAEDARRCFDETYTQFSHHAGDSIRQIAGLPAFREAVTWQNRAAIRTALDPLLREPANGNARSSRQKQHEELVASYWQRYCVKNDTIGFFGPVGWATFVSEGDRVVTKAGRELVKARKVYLEAWALEALSAAIQSKYQIRQWIAPILMPFVRVGNTVLYHPNFGPIRITSKQAAILRACNGEDTAKQVVEKILASPAGRSLTENDIYRVLSEMADKSIVFWTLNIPFGPHPEKALRLGLQRIEDVFIRHSALGMLDELESARRGIEASAGNPQNLDYAFDKLEQVFTKLTGLSATRNQGKIYAGRTLVYEDCRRDIEVLLGPELLQSIALPLSLLLETTRWLTERVAAIYKARCLEIHSKLARINGTAIVDAAQLWTEAMSLFFDGATELTKPIQQEFQRKWDSILQLPESGEPVNYSSHELRSRVQEEFQADGPGWIAARYHSPDIMIAADSEDAIRRGDYVLVMGEMHVSKNTLDASLFVNQHPSPEGLFSFVERDLGLKVVPMPLQTDEQGCRTNPSLVSQNSFRLEYSRDAFTDNRARAISLSSVVLENQNGELFARTRDGQICMSWVDLVGALLSVMVIDSFKMIAPRPHTPRISIDRLVIKRESWSFAPSVLEFASCATSAERFLQARKWAQSNGIPRFVFFKVPVEGKPAYLDFDSPILVDIFSKMVRRTIAESLPDATVDVSEMLPQPTQAWLPDIDGQRYTSELRIVAVDNKQSL